MPPRKSGRGVKRGADEISAEPVSLSDNDCYSFKPENLSDITVHYQSKSYHLHKYVLVTKSKFFEAALLTAKSDDACTSPDCVTRGDSHRCVTLEGNQIGGVSISTDDLLTFFYYMYAAADSNGEWEKLIDSKRKPASPSFWPNYFYIAVIREVNAATDTTLLDMYSFDGLRKHEMKGAACGLGAASNKLSSYGVGISLSSSTLVEHPNLHLADYFQADSMRKQYETHSALAVKVASEDKSYIAIWRILQVADRYGWKDVRATCIPMCAKDTKLIAPWKEFARKLKPDTLIEIFEASRKASS